MNLIRARSASGASASGRKTSPPAWIIRTCSVLESHLRLAHSKKSIGFLGQKPKSLRTAERFESRANKLLTDLSLPGERDASCLLFLEQRVCECAICRKLRFLRKHIYINFSKNGHTSISTPSPQIWALQPVRSLKK